MQHTHTRTRTYIECKYFVNPSPFTIIEISIIPFVFLASAQNQVDNSGSSDRIHSTVPYAMSCPGDAQCGADLRSAPSSAVQCSAVHSIVLHSIQQIHDCECSNGLRSWWGSLHHHVGDSHGYVKKVGTQLRVVRTASDELS